MPQYTRIRSKSPSQSFGGGLGAPVKIGVQFRNNVSFDLPQGSYLAAGAQTFTINLKAAKAIGLPVLPPKKIFRNAAIRQNVRRGLQAREDGLTKVEEITCRFVGDCEVADNIVRNATAQCQLDAANKDRMLNKLMVIQVGSLVEVCLDQIIFRAKNHNREGVANINEEDRKAIAEKNVEKFLSIIKTMQDYKILDEMGADIYDELHKLRKYRKKLHIQDNVDVEGVSRKENGASPDDVKWSLQLAVRIFKYLNEKFSQPAALDQYCSGNHGS